jgi:hypothetical protein
MLNMEYHKITKSPIIVMTLALLVVAATVANSANLVHAQGNATKGNLTAVIDVDTLSKDIKERHPLLAKMAADEDKDLIVVIKGLDPKEAAKTILALNMLRLLQQYKQVDVS